MLHDRRCKISECDFRDIFVYIASCVVLVLAFVSESEWDATTFLIDQFASETSQAFVIDTIYFE